MKRNSAKQKHPFANQSVVLNAQIAYNQYGGYCVPYSSIHRPASQRILAGEVYEPDTIEFILSHLGSGDIIHGGTFFGDFLPAISNKLTAEAKLFAFEPNSESFRCAQITIALNNLRNINFSNAAMGEQNRDAQLQIRDESGKPLGGGSTITDNIPEHQSEKVKLLTIDSIYPKERTVTVLHLDVEGYEQQALLGAIDTITRCKPILILEDNNNISASDWFSEEILPLGYSFSNMLHNNKVFETK